MNVQKRICVINDISCVGRCSSTAALPICSAAGIHVNLLPTALLSSQTGGYTDYTFKDLSSELIKIAEHFKKLGLKFDALLTGYITGNEQLETVLDIIDLLNPSIIIADPVMGDGGELYSGFSKDYCNKMKSLCKKADIITPNLTETGFLLDIEYEQAKKADPKDLLKKLIELGAKKAVITGLKRQTDKATQTGVAAYDGSETYIEFFPELNGFFHGSGDVFSSALACGIVHGKSLYGAVKTAHEFTNKAIEITHAAKTDTRQGLNFEKCLDMVLSEYNN